MQEIFKQLVFLTSEKPLDQVLKTILVLHAVNLHHGLKLIGLREEDVEQEYEGLPEGWDKHESGVYSLKYVNKKKEIFQFKFVTHSESPWLNIFVMKLNDNKRLCSSQIDTSKLKFDNQQEIFESPELKTYKQEVLAITGDEDQTQKKTNQPNQGNILSEPQPQGMFWNQQRNFNPPEQSNFGRSDLDPFFRQGNSTQGGNLMGPGYFNNFQQQQQQQTNPQNPLNVPPGARFDPFGPTPNINGSYYQFEQQNPRRGGNNNFPF